MGDLRRYIESRAQKDSLFRHTRKAGQSLVSFGEQIASACIDRGINQDQLVKEVGVNLDTLKEIESGMGRPSLEVLHAIAEALGKQLVLRLEDPDLTQ